MKFRADFLRRYPQKNAAKVLLEQAGLAQLVSTAKLFSAFCSKILEPDFYCRVAKSPKEF